MVRQRRPDPDAHVATAAAFSPSTACWETYILKNALMPPADRAMKRLYQLKLARQLDRPRLPALIDQKAPMQLAGMIVVMQNSFVCCKSG